MSLSNMTLSTFEVSIKKGVAKDNPRAELVCFFAAIRWLALKQNCRFPQRLQRLLSQFHNLDVLLQNNVSRRVISYHVGITALALIKSYCIFDERRKSILGIQIGSVCPRT
jgi:hypothetical protein